MCDVQERWDAVTGDGEEWLFFLWVQRQVQIGLFLASK